MEAGNKHILRKAAINGGFLLRVRFLFSISGLKYERHGSYYYRSIGVVICGYRGYQEG